MTSGLFSVASWFKLFGAAITCLLLFTCTYVFLCLQVVAMYSLMFKSLIYNILQVVLD